MLTLAFFGLGAAVGLGLFALGFTDVELLIDPPAPDAPSATPAARQATEFPLSGARHVEFATAP